LETASLFKAYGTDVCAALSFAENAHKGQKRKYDDEPYIQHPIRVATRLIDWGIQDPHILCPALLHDVYEDTSTTVPEVYHKFGAVIATRVLLLTEPSFVGLSRAERKVMYNVILASACDAVKLVKLADIFDNLSDFHTMVQNEPGFAPVYLQEKENCVLQMSRSISEIMFDPTMEVLNLIRACRDTHLG
jgi:(p)ppGpp synthase/HD superfamily hydrolase